MTKMYYGDWHMLSTIYCLKDLHRHGRGVLGHIYTHAPKPWVLKRTKRITSLALSNGFHLSNMLEETMLELIYVWMANWHSGPRRIWGLPSSPCPYQYTCPLSLKYLWRQRRLTNFSLVDGSSLWIYPTKISINGLFR